MINSNKLVEALFPIEERLRILSKAGKGSCYIFAIYDICRTKADELKKLSDDQKEQADEESKEKKEEEAKGNHSESTRGDGPVSKGKVQVNLF